MSFSWSRYDSLLNDPEPGTSIWDYEIEDEPEPDSETIVCAECGYEVEDVFEFDGIPHCGSCFANCLSPDLELEAEIRRMVEEDKVLLKERESFSAVEAAVS